jgi:ABC-2 type transport system permease protein
MKPFYKLTLASFKQFSRDRTAMFFAFAFPLIFMVIFGLIYSNTGSVNYNIGLVEVDNTSGAAMVIAQSLSKIPIFTISQGILDDKLNELKKGDLRAVIVIPADIETAMGSGQASSITVYYDPAQTSSAQILLPVLRQAVSEINRQLTQQPVLLQLSEESVQSKSLRDIDYLVPGILAMAIMFLCLFGGLTLVQWRERQVLKRFSATPTSRATLIASQVVYRLILSVLQAIIIVAVAQLLFKVQMVGNWLALFGVVCFGALTLVSLGYLAVSRVKTTEGATPIIQIVMFPMMFLSGIFFPVEIMPSFMHPIVAAMPLTYLGDALRQVMANATPLYSISTDFAAMAAWLVVCMLLTIRLFRWE